MAVKKITTYPWIKLRKGLRDDPDVIAIADKIDLDEFAVVGRLSDVWDWVDSNSADGTGLTVSDKWIDRRVSCQGFAEAMRSVGWLTGTDRNLTFPHWDRHNSNTAKARALEAEAKRLRRAGQLEDEESDDCPTNEGRNEDSGGGESSDQRKRKRKRKSIEQQPLEEKKLPPPPAQVADVVGTETVSGGGGVLKSDEGIRPTKGSGDDGPTWREVTAELTAAGLNMAAEAARAAKKHGATPGHCRAVLEFWRSHPGAWGVGIIYSRFTNPELCNLAPAAGWPTPAARVITTNSDNEARERQVAQFAEIDASKTRADETRRELDELVDEHGTAIDQLSDEEILELLPAGPARFAFKHHGWRAELIRGRVLRAFVEKYLAEPVTS